MKTIYINKEDLLKVAEILHSIDGGFKIVNLVRDDVHLELTQAQIEELFYFSINWGYVG